MSWLDWRAKTTHAASTAVVSRRNGDTTHQNLCTLCAKSECSLVLCIVHDTLVLFCGPPAVSQPYSPLFVNMIEFENVSTRAQGTYRRAHCCSRSHSNRCRRRAPADRGRGSNGVGREKRGSRRVEGKEGVFFMSAQHVVYFNFSSIKSFVNGIQLASKRSQYVPRAKPQRAVIG